MVQIISFRFIRFIPIFLLLFHYSYSSTVELIKEGSKYEREEYIKFFEIPKDLMEIETNAGELRKLSLAFDNNFDTNWISLGSFQDAFKDFKTGVQYNALYPNITITFSKKVLLNRMIYKAFSIPLCENGLGYPTLLEIYYKNRDSKGNLSLNDDDFKIIDFIQSKATGDKVVFLFFSI